MIGVDHADRVIGRGIAAVDHGAVDSTGAAREQPP
jgi:hypothetical protein